MGGPFFDIAVFNTQARNVNTQEGSMSLYWNFQHPGGSRGFSINLWESLLEVKVKKYMYDINISKSLTYDVKIKMKNTNVPVYFEDTGHTVYCIRCHTQTKIDHLHYTHIQCRTLVKFEVLN